MNFRPRNIIDLKVFIKTKSPDSPSDWSSRNFLIFLISHQNMFSPRFLTEISQKIKSHTWSLVTCSVCPVQIFSQQLLRVFSQIPHRNLKSLSETLYAWYYWKKYCTNRKTWKIKFFLCSQIKTTFECHCSNMF